MFQNFLTSKVRLFPQWTGDISMCTMANLPSAQLMALLVGKLGMNENLITLETVYHFKKYITWFWENISTFDDEYFIFFLENYYHSSDYALGFLYEALENLEKKGVQKKIIIHSFKLDEAEAKSIMNRFSSVVLVVRTDIEYFFYQLFEKKNAIENIANIVYRNQDGVPIATKTEEVSYDLSQYIFSAYDSGIIFRKEKSSTYIASLLDDDDERTDPKYYYRQPREKKLLSLSNAAKSHQMMLVTGRGCKYKCSYCFRGSKYSIVRQIPLEIIKKDLDALQKAGTTKVYIYDDCFLTTNHGRLRELVELLSKYPMTYNIALRYEMCTPETLQILAPLKFYLVQIGLQTVSKETNGLVGRGLNHDKFEKVLGVFHERSVYTSIDIILGLPGESFHDFIRTFSYAISLAPKSIVINSLFLNPSTQLYEKKDVYGIQTTGGNLFTVPFIIESASFPKEDIERARKYIMKAMDMYPEIRFILR